MIILGIETSCDETSSAILQIKQEKFFLLSQTTYSQIQDHKKYGGVIPEMAARLHVPKILPVIQKSLDDANINIQQINAIAVTNGPGLVPSLIVGIHTARILSILLEKPLIAVNHLEGHLLSPFLNHNIEKLKTPALCLIISGGHTELILINKINEYKIIGRTRDDAVGEAFDKVAKLLGLPYPGGPYISKLAEEATEPINFPKPLIKSNDFDFSFSGLKTAVLYYIQQQKTLNDKLKANISAGFQNSVVQVLLHKLKKAINFYKPKTILLGGGVIANKVLRQELIKLEKKIQIPILLPELKFCGDNAAMIALASYFKYKRKEFTQPEKIKAIPTLTL